MGTWAAEKLHYRMATCHMARDVLEGGGGGGGGLKGVGGGEGVWLGPPSSLGPPRVPAEAQILLAPKAPKQNFGCQPQTLEGEEGGRCTAVLKHHCTRDSHPSNRAPLPPMDSPVHRPWPILPQS